MQKEKIKLSFIQKVYLDNLDAIREELLVQNDTVGLKKALNKIGIHSSNFSDESVLDVEDEYVIEDSNHMILIPLKDHRTAQISCILKGKEHERYRLSKPTVIFPNKTFKITTKVDCKIFALHLTEDFTIDMIRYSFLNNNPW